MQSMRGRLRYRYGFKTSSGVKEIFPRVVDYPGHAVSRVFFHNFIQSADGQVITIKVTEPLFLNAYDEFQSHRFTFIFTLTMP